MRNSLALFSSLLALTACSDVPSKAFYDRGQPESLLDLSVETVNVSLAPMNASSDLVSWVNRDQPSRAELHCSISNPECSRARDVFNQFSIPVEMSTPEENEAVLIYERVMARDCENRYINNTINPYNLNHPTYGCSIAANMVQMVGDKRQFASPDLLDFHDSERLEVNYRNYASGKPPVQQPLQRASRSLLQNLPSSR